MPTYAEPEDGVHIHPVALRQWTAALVARVGTPTDIAEDVAEILVAADCRGIASHGTARLPNYVALIEARAMEAAARPVVERRHGGVTVLDACNGWGQHAGRVAVDRAIERARQVGVAIALVRNSNHYGIAGWYALRAADAGMVGLSFTNSSPLVAPTRAMRALIGTNPIAIAAPAGRYGTFCLDMATATVPRGRIEVAARRGERLQAGWAIGPDGRPAKTPQEALAGALLPLGGMEETAGYKGYGLSLAVDILTGVLAGATFGPNIVGLFSTGAASDLGHAFWAIDLASVGGRETFERRLEAYLDQLTSAETVPGAPGPVLVPGEPERQASRRAEQDGLVLDAQHHAALIDLGRRFGVPLPA